MSIQTPAQWLASQQSGTQPSTSSRIQTPAEWLKTHPSSSEPETLLQKGVGFVKSMATDAVNTLLVKPAARATEAVTRVVAPNSLAAKGYEAMSDESQSQTFKAPVLGDINVAPVKAFGQGGGEQIAGEALKSATYLAPYGKLTTALGSGLKAEMILGGAGAGTYGAGQAMEEGKSAGDVLKDTAIGTALGVATGGALYGAGKLLKGKPKINATETPMINNVDNVLKNIISKTENVVPEKIVYNSPVELRASRANNKEEFIGSEIQFLQKTKQKVPAKLQENLSKIYDKVKTNMASSEAKVEVPVSKKYEVHPSVQTPEVQNTVNKIVEQAKAESPDPLTFESTSFKERTERIESQTIDHIDNVIKGNEKPIQGTTYADYWRVASENAEKMKDTQKLLDLGLSKTKVIKSSEAGKELGAFGMIDKQNTASIISDVVEDKLGKLPGRIIKNKSTEIESISQSIKDLFENIKDVIPTKEDISVALKDLDNLICK